MCISIFVGQFRKSCQFAAKHPAQHISWSQFFENQCVLFRDLCAINIYINVNSFQDINIFYDFFFNCQAPLALSEKSASAKFLFLSKAAPSSQFENHGKSVGVASGNTSGKLWKSARGC